MTIRSAEVGFGILHHQSKLTSTLENQYVARTQFQARLKTLSLNP